ncbi:hypothetical protein T552_03370 [Pneumocystis carinii B80]|uniref:Ran-specific GTPase-activating protein 30 n=1 Tax=Pneumocystis carinii (strain B80) TaxID=1408658 RepID=A0A0W4ZBN7_PNEC8|nr:hypothetical protein T552_03370 [Pneumocystis carinii B80]KTW25757.1 hypothetical protein T552_03370 [Pneumocystis carinii B80]
MDDFLAKVSIAAATFAIRSGVSIAGGIALRQVSRYIKDMPSQSQRQMLDSLKKQLEQKIRIVTPAIDLIEIISARGNTSLGSTVHLTNSLRRDINAFAKRVSDAADEQEISKHINKNNMGVIMADMKNLLSRIEDAVPLISLALTTSGANISSSLPNTVSPSRLLQASSFLISADSLFCKTPTLKFQQVGPVFVLKLYTIFSGSARIAHMISTSDITWKEEHAKCLVSIIRVDLNDSMESKGDLARKRVNEYAYELQVIEDLNDGRYHEEIEKKSMKKSKNGHIHGSRRNIPIHLISRLFFSASGRLLNIEEAKTPVLVLKLNHALSPPRKLLESIRDDDTEDSETQENVDEESFYDKINDPENIEWIAFEIWNDDMDDEEESQDNTSSNTSDVSESSSDNDNCDNIYENVNNGDNCNNDKGYLKNMSSSDNQKASKEITNDGNKVLKSEKQVDEFSAALKALDINVETTDEILELQKGSNTNLETLSLLEYIIRLTALQTSEQTSLLSVTDERISLFLRDDSHNSRTRERTGALEYGETPRSSPSSIKLEKDSIKSQENRRIRKDLLLNSRNSPRSPLSLG